MELIGAIIITIFIIFYVPIIILIYIFTENEVTIYILLFINEIFAFLFAIACIASYGGQL